MNVVNPDIESSFRPLAIIAPAISLPLALVIDGQPHPWCRLAVSDLQQYIRVQKWEHNFGLEQMEGKVIGKMFGVLVVKSISGNMGYLSAFSGKLAGSNHHPGFVPPVYDSLSEDGFLNAGMRELAELATAIKHMVVRPRMVNPDVPGDNEASLQVLRQKRKAHSASLQHRLYQQYKFLNRAGEVRSLSKLFTDAGYRNPPSGAGECAGPKLLQYAFQHGFEPLALAEFWWGQSPKSLTWKHGEFYPCCKEKCEPILKHMLEGIVKS